MNTGPIFSVERHVKLCGVACLLLVVGCQTRLAATPKPESLPPDCAQRSAGGATTAPKASIVFIGEGADILNWDFLVRGLPATDLRTGSIVVADLFRGFIASSLGLSLLWLKAGEMLPVRTLSVLEENVASTILYERDDDAKAVAALAESARTRTREANEILGALELRPTVPCAVQRMKWCDHPQRLVCSELAGELRGDTLHWGQGGNQGETVLGWGVAPMEIGDGPAKEMLTCIDEAHFDRQTMQIVAQVTTYCKEPGSDACMIPSGWRVISLR